MEQPRVYYRRHLPHYQPSYGTFFVTFRLAGSLPGHVAGRMRREREEANRRFAGMNDVRRKHEEHRAYEKSCFEKFDALLDRDEVGPHWLGQPQIAQLLLEAIKYRHGKDYDLLACCIMPNHVHMLFTVGRDAIPASTDKQARSDCVGRIANPTYKPLFRILQSLKRHTAREANKVLGRTGTFWQNESYDHVVRDDGELERLFWYVLLNPVKARLAESWIEWPWIWWKPEYVD